MKILGSSSSEEHGSSKEVHSRSEEHTRSKGDSSSEQHARSKGHSSKGDSSSEQHARSKGHSRSEGDSSGEEVHSSEGDSSSKSWNLEREIKNKIKQIKKYATSYKKDEKKGEDLKLLSFDQLNDIYIEFMEGDTTMKKEELEHKLK